VTLRQRLLRQPQGVWARRALFQVHLWTGIGVGVYIFVISVSGSAIVYRREIAKLFWERPTVAAAGRLMTPEELRAAVKTAYPRFEIAPVTIPDPNRAVVVVMTRAERRRERVFNPYTGEDLGEVAPGEPEFLSWLVRLHDDLLADRTGRTVNGLGALFLTVLCVTGAVIWWPGTSRWRRSMLVRWNAGWRVFNWDLHSAIGFWMFAFVFIWAISGLYLSIPGPFGDLVDYLQPLSPDDTEPRSGDNVLAWLARIHFGRAWGTTVKGLYTFFGLVPAVLFVTGALMWWNRVLRPAFRNSTAAVETVEPEISAEV
jgi:uncharacterized iron-regulated membrane protein